MLCAYRLRCLPCALCHGSTTDIRPPRPVTSGPDSAVPGCPCLRAPGRCRSHHPTGRCRPATSTVENTKNKITPAPVSLRRTLCTPQNHSNTAEYGQNVLTCLKPEGCIFPYFLYAVRPFWYLLFTNFTKCLHYVLK